MPLLCLGVLFHNFLHLDRRELSWTGYKCTVKLRACLYKGRSPIPRKLLVFPQNKISRESEKACSVIWKRKAQLCFCLSQSNESQLRKHSTPLFRQKQRKFNLCRNCTCSAVDTADWEALVHLSKTKSKCPGSPSPPGVSLKYLRSTDFPGDPSISSKDEGKQHCLPYASCF